ncbi:MAG TPA: hypothetical protein VHQ65_08890 [Thermoanaerobaculia bacterium]|nr:hypothetical protein [Thermoanaerobaculia bacterium]
MPRRCATLLALTFLLAPVAIAQPAPAGPPFAVSVQPVSVAPAPAVAIDALGRSLFLWIGQCGGAEDFGLCGRLYGAEGQPLGAPHLVAPASEGFDTVPALTALPGGGWFVAWSQPEQGFAREIAGRRLATDGTPAAPPVLLASQSAQVFGQPALGADAAGNLVVVFEKRRFEGTTGEGDEATPIYVGVEILGRRTDAAGTPQGAIFRVDGESPDLVSRPTVAVAPDGAFLAAWESFDFATSDDDVLVRRFTPAPGGGATPAGGEQRAHQTVDGSQIRPVAAASIQGSYLVAWQGPATAGRSGVFLQVFGAGGPVFAADVGAGSGSDGEALPAAAGGDGVLAVAWQDGRHGGSIYAQRFAASGQPLGPDFRVSEAAAGRALTPALAAGPGSGAGSGLTAGWSLEEPDFDRAVLGRRYPAVAAPPVPCVAGSQTLCLGPGDRFRVTATWRTAQSTSGSGQVERLTTDTGYLWFFRETNIEVVVKALDGCGVNQHFWVFAAGLTNVGVTITVEDTVAGGTRVYENPLGRPFQPVQDTGAFPCDG